MIDLKKLEPFLLNELMFSNNFLITCEEYENFIGKKIVPLGNQFFIKGYYTLDDKKFEAYVYFDNTKAWKVQATGRKEYYLKYHSRISNFPNANTSVNWDSRDEDNVIAITTITFDEDSSEPINTTESNSVSLYNPYEETNIYLENKVNNTVTEIRYGLGWTLDENSLYAADFGFGETIGLANLIAISSDILDKAKLKKGSTYKYEIDLYLVWSANYYGLETAATSFQSTYMVFPNGADRERGRFYTGTPLYARLPVTDSTADSRYVYNNTNNEAQTLYTRAMSSNRSDARDAHLKYDTQGRYAWVAPAIGTAQLPDMTQDDFSEATTTNLNNTYKMCTDQLLKIARHRGQGLLSYLQQSTLDDYASLLSTAVRAPAISGSILYGMQLEPIHTDEAFVIDDVLATAQTVDGNMDDLCGTGTSVTIPQAYASLLSEPINNPYPHTMSGEQHSYDSLLVLCNAVFDPYKIDNTYSFNIEQRNSIYVGNSQDPEIVSVKKLYDTFIEIQNDLIGLKMPSMYRYKYLITRLAMVYHSLSVKKADFSEFEALWPEYMRATWCANLDIYFDENIIMGLTTYFTDDSVTALNNTYNTLIAYRSTWTAVIQEAVDGKRTSGTRTCRNTGATEYYNLSAAEAAPFNYKEGTLCDQLLDAIDALIPKQNYTITFDLNDKIGSSTASLDDATGYTLVNAKDLTHSTTYSKRYSIVDSVTAPVPQRNGYWFRSWLLTERNDSWTDQIGSYEWGFNEENIIPSVSNVTGNVEFMALYGIQYYPVHINPDGGEMTITYIETTDEDESLPSSETITSDPFNELPEEPFIIIFGTTAELSVPEKEGYTFDHWEYDVMYGTLTDNGSTDASIFVAGAQPSIETEDGPVFVGMTLTAIYTQNS